jgi:hypothetical protein
MKTETRFTSIIKKPKYKKIVSKITPIKIDCLNKKVTYSNTYCNVHTCKHKMDKTFTKVGF